MFFYLYFLGAFLFILFLMSIIIYFGKAYIGGAPYAVSTPEKTKQIVSMLKKETKKTKGKKGKAVDLGSGDGRVVIELAKAGFEAHGFESNIYLVWWSRYKIKKAGLQGRAFIHKKNYWKQNLGEFDVVVLFGVFYIMEKLQGKLFKELKPGTLVVSNFFEFPNWKEIRKDNKLYIYRK